MLVEILPYQRELYQVVNNVQNNKDYKILKNTFERLNDIINLAGLDRFVIESHFAGLKSNNLSLKVSKKNQEKCRVALRCIIARAIFKESFRKFSSHLADSNLLQWFCRVNNFGSVIKVPCKTTLEVFEKMIPIEVIESLNTELAEKAMIPNAKSTSNPLLLLQALNTDNYYLDSTCIFANIHFPVDWLLLRDATKTLMQSVNLIRAQNLKSRMPFDPKKFITEMNKLCINMTHTKNKKGARKGRKAIFRAMKKLIMKIGKHAQKHRDLLSENWQNTEYSLKQAVQIIKRIDNIIMKLPDVIYQATERIIGGRPINNNDKILSLYEDDVNVYVRGKAGARIEFGNYLLIGETSQGFILNWDFVTDKIPSDTKMLIPHLEDMKKMYKTMKLKSVTTDRGFDSAKNDKYLKKNETGSNICPKSVSKMRTKLEEESFVIHQKRRGQTEGRISILKHHFIGNPIKSKGTENRQRSVAIGILSHNLWLTARLPHTKQNIENLPQIA